MSDPLTFPSRTARFSLPLLFAGQAQKEFTVNETVSRIAALLHASIEAEVGDPPAAPEDGRCWLVGAFATGAWAGREGSIACHASGDWLFVDPVPGMRCYDHSSGATLFYDGDWKRPARPPAVEGGVTQDSEARAAIAALVDSLAEAGILGETPS